MLGSQKSGVVGQRHDHYVDLVEEDEEAHRFPTAAPIEPTAPATSAPRENGFHQSSPVGSTYRSGLFTAHKYRLRDCGTVR